MTSGAQRLRATEKAAKAQRLRLWRDYVAPTPSIDAAGAGSAPWSSARRRPDGGRESHRRRAEGAPRVRARAARRKRAPRPESRALGGGGERVPPEAVRREAVPREDGVRPQDRRRRRRAVGLSDCARAPLEFRHGASGERANGCVRRGRRRRGRASAYSRARRVRQAPTATSSARARARFAGGGAPRALSLNDRGQNPNKEAPTHHVNDIAGNAVKAWWSRPFWRSAPGGVTASWSTSSRPGSKSRFPRKARWFPSRSPVRGAPAAAAGVALRTAMAAADAGASLCVRAAPLHAARRRDRGGRRGQGGHVPGEPVPRSPRRGRVWVPKAMLSSASGFCARGWGCTRPTARKRTPTARA